MLPQSPRATLTLPSDSALEIAKEFDALLSSFTANGTLDKLDPAMWQAIERGGWLDAGKDMGGERFDVLDLAELATAWGRHLVPGPFISTLIARRHLGSSSLAGPGGFTFSLVPGPGALVPFGGVPGCTFLSYLGRDGASAGAAGSATLDDSSPSLPLAAAANGSRVDPEIVHEAVVLHAAEMIGLAERLLQRTVDFANVRKTFGQEVGKFQAIRFRMADIHFDIEAMRGLVVAAANEPELAPRAARRIARMTRRIAEACLQTHGAMGFTWDLGIHWYLRHAMAADSLLSQYAATQPGILGES